jgi:hypothetical protein
MLASNAGAATCESLKSVAIRNVTIVSAEPVAIAALRRSRFRRIAA